MSIKIISIKYSDKELIEKALKIREIVFVNEQNVPKDIEYDGLDKDANHFLIFSDKKAVGTARYRKTKKGLKLERFAILKEHRNKGLASQLLKFMLKETEGKYDKIYLYSQINAVNFYKKHNFTIVGNEFMEAGIVHYEMEYMG